MSKYKFGQRSEAQLRTLHPDLQAVLVRALDTGIMDFSILKGYRGEEEQNEAYNTGRSQLKYPKSRHNTYPAEAVDVAPYPIDWNDTERFARLAGLIQGVASLLNIDLTWGGDWVTLKDMPHFEIKK